MSEEGVLYILSITGGWKICLFLYTFFLTSTISNAGFSISLGILCIFTIYMYAHVKQKIIWPDRSFMYLYSIFWGGLALASFLSGDVKSIEATGKYLSYTIPFWIIYFSYKYLSSDCTWGRGISVSMLVLSAVSIYQFFVLQVGTRISGFFFTSPNGLAGVLESVFPYLVLYFFICSRKHYIWEKYIVAIIIVMTGFALLASQSRGGIAGWILGGAFLCIIRYIYATDTKKIIVKSLVSIGVFVVIFSGVTFFGTETFQRSYDQERLLMIESSYEMWKDNRLYGVGFDNWQQQYHNYYLSPEAKEPNIPMPHNNIAFFFSTTGIIGGSVYIAFSLGLIVLLLKKIRKDPNNLYYQAALWTFIAISIHGLVDAGLTNKFSMRILSFGLGIAFSSDNRHIF